MAEPSPYRALMDRIGESIDNDETFTVEMTVLEGIAVLAQLQTALHQPGEGQITAGIAAGVAERLVDAIAPADSPLRLLTALHPVALVKGALQ